MSIWIKDKENKTNNQQTTQFEVLELLGLVPSRAGELLIDDLAREQVNAVHWQLLTTNSEKFNNYFKSNKWLWEDLYSISKESLKGGAVGFVVKVKSGEIVPCKILELSCLALAHKIIRATVLIDTVKFKDATWRILWKFDIDKNHVETVMELIEGTDLEPNDKESFLKKHGYYYLDIDILENLIPLVQWSSLPNNEVFLQQSLEKAKKLSVTNDMYMDQLINAMTKRVYVDTNQNTNGPRFVQKKNSADLIFKPISYIKSNTLDEFDRTQALYQPNSVIIRDFRNNIDWLEANMRNNAQIFQGKDSKNSDSESTKTTAHLLDLNLMIWKSNLGQLVELYDQAVSMPVIDLNLRPSVRES